MLCKTRMFIRATQIISKVANNISKNQQRNTNFSRSNTIHHRHQPLCTTSRTTLLTKGVSTNPRKIKISNWTKTLWINPTPSIKAVQTKGTNSAAGTLRELTLNYNSKYLKIIQIIGMPTWLRTTSKVRNGKMERNNKSNIKQSNRCDIIIGTFAYEWVYWMVNVMPFQYCTESSIIRQKGKLFGHICSASFLPKCREKPMPYCEASAGKAKMTASFGPYLL